MKVPLGEMRTPVALRTLTTGTDAAGGETKTWAQGRTFYVRLRAMRGQERTQYQQVHAEVSHVAFGHYEALKNATERDQLRAVETSVDYDIQAVLPEEERDQVQLVLVRRKDG